MRSLVCAVFATAILSLAPAAFAQSRLTSVDPMNGKPGDAATTSGENIGKGKVAELFLTDGTNDFKVVMVEQNETQIKFTIPATIKPARYALMIKTGGSQARLLEQLVKITVE